MSKIEMTYFIAREVIALREISKQTAEHEQLSEAFDRLLLAIFSLDRRDFDEDLNPSPNP